MTCASFKEIFLNCNNCSHYLNNNVINLLPWRRWVQCHLPHLMILKILTSYSYFNHCWYYLKQVDSNLWNSHLLLNMQVVQYFPCYKLFRSTAFHSFTWNEYQYCQKQDRICILEEDHLCQAVNILINIYSFILYICIQFLLNTILKIVLYVFVF